MSILDGIVNLAGKLIYMTDYNVNTDFTHLRKQARHQYGHLIGRTVIWIAPSGKPCHGVATEVDVYGDGEVWLRVEYFINRYDNGEPLAMTEVMRVDSYRVADARGLHWSIENVNALPMAA